ncbi:YdcF family protein [Histidinibacterium lentulum]|uniref:YdcF family protein n=1 Tax=Histidinibacterium lentulum TaxID=2480588 RepID=A0A3N2R7Z0_9RHOB|nr:YdcF family protein [Histidinibacterium lentulum]ROU03612.1 YdcF family protein [Histidinibacterium lentulum]
MRVILLLGAAVHMDGPSPALRDRAVHAARLWQAGEAAMVLASGGARAGRMAEAEAAAGVLGGMGVPESAIRLECAARSTWENLLFSRPILREMGAAEVLLVTDRLHMPRALIAARKTGVRVLARPAVAGGDRRLWRLALREAAACAAYALRRREPGRGAGPDGAGRTGRR